MGTNLGFESRIIGKTLVDGYHLALPVDDKRCRDGFNTTVVRDNFLIAHNDSVVHPQFAHERLDHTGSLLVKRDPNDDQAFLHRTFFRVYFSDRKTGLREITNRSAERLQKSPER